MSIQELENEIINKIRQIEEKERLENNRDAVAEPVSQYTPHPDNPEKVEEDEEVIQLTEAQMRGLLEGLDDILMGRVISDEEAEEELDRLFAEWDKEK